MGLREDWQRLAKGLPSLWSEARVELRVGPEHAAEAAALLAPLQPLRAGETSFVLELVTDGSGPGSSALLRTLHQLDEHHIGGTLTLIAHDETLSAAPPTTATLTDSWLAALEQIPADWSDLLAEVELESSDYLDRASLDMAPINPRRSGPLSTLRFRAAAHAGFGASPGMVRTCLGRCDRDGIHGEVRIIRVLCGTRAVGTQGPVWQIDGHTA